MNVLYVCADRGIPLLGSKGASVHVRSITAAIRDLGHDVTIAARSFGEGNPAPAGIRLARLGGDEDADERLLRRLIREQQPQVVIERYSLESGAARRATARCDVPLTLEVNAPLVAEAERFRGLCDPNSAARERLTLRTSDRIHVVSAALFRYARATAPGVPVAHIPNGAAVERLRAAEPADLAGLRGRTVVGFVGSMKPWHGAEDLLEAFALARAGRPDAAALFVGSGPLQEALQAAASRHLLGGHVHFAGHVPHAGIPPLLQRIDIGAAPYRPLDDFYFQPLKVVEYLAAGKPVIYAEQGELPELVGPAGSGYPAGSVPGLARALGALLDDRPMRRRMAAHAARIGAALDWSVIARRVLRFAADAADAADTRAGVPDAAAGVAPPRVMRAAEAVAE